MERIDTAVINKIRDGLINRYDKDQQMQQLIEEIGAEEGLNEQELSIVYQAYLEVKERMQYTANLVELWNQIEAVQHRMDLLHTYDSLENDLLGDDGINLDGSIDNAAGHGNEKKLGYGAGKSDTHNYIMEQVELHEVEPVTMNTVFDLNNNVEKKQSKKDKHSEGRSKEQKKIDKLLKKQMKRIEKEWAKISGKLDKDEKKSKSKEDKIAKKEAKKLEKAAKKAEKQGLKKSGKKKHS